MKLQLGATALDFEAETTAGRIRFHEWGRDASGLEACRRRAYRRRHVRPGGAGEIPSRLESAQALCARRSAATRLIPVAGMSTTCKEPAQV